MLSHSSSENLTKHWVNTTALEPVKIPCYPCHRMHHTSTFCPQDEKLGASVCATSISPFHMFQAIGEALAPPQQEAAE